MGKHFVEAVYKAFEKEREEFYRKHFPDLFKEEVIIKQEKKTIKLERIDSTCLYCMRLDHVRPMPAYDVYFSLGIKYKKHSEYDGSREAWVETRERYMQNGVQSPYMKGIFRDKVDFPWRALAASLQSKEIKLICLRDYTGGLTKKEFEGNLLKQGIYVHFIE
jgi:hypothetical protein